MDWPQAFVWVVGIICGTVAFVAVLGACATKTEPKEEDDEEFAD